MLAAQIAQDRLQEFSKSRIVAIRARFRPAFVAHKGSAAALARAESSGMMRLPVEHLLSDVMSHYESSVIMLKASLARVSLSRSSMAGES